MTPGPAGAPGRGTGRAAAPGRAGRTRVKLCGLSRPADVTAALGARPDCVGFVVGFPRSRRNVDPEALPALARPLWGSPVELAGVFVDADPALVADVARAARLDWVQLHGSEDAAYVARLRGLLAGSGARPARVVQAFRVRSAADAGLAERSPADLVLLDSGQGSGEAFDWGLARLCRRPYVLAGGLGPGNVARAVAELAPWGVDMSSGIETDGAKDPAKMRAAVAAVRGVGI